MSRVLPIVVALWIAIADLRAAGEWITLEDCRFMMNPSNDGDSFHVRADKKEYIFRLYFVDAPETDARIPGRLREQAQYFSITIPQTKQVGVTAKLFAQGRLASSFAVRTCMEDAMGQSKLQRFYAFVRTKEGDLGEQLIENGLARVHGASATPSGLTSAQNEWDKLRRLENEAKQGKLGVWGINVGGLSRRAPTKGSSSFDAFFHAQKAATPQMATTPQTKSTLKETFETKAGKGRLDVNSATLEELEKIDGIGPAVAGRIIAARPFKSADDLRNVKGISAAKFAKIRRCFN